MDEYLSESEQVDRIRQWWKQNGAWIIVGIGGGILALAGWNWWQNYQLQRAEQASAIFSVVAEAGMEGRIDEVRLGLERLEAGHGSSPYLHHGRLVLAGALVRSGDSAGAIRLLEQVMDGARDPELKSVARLRLARVLLSTGESERALGLARGIETGAFAAPFLELKGDALLVRGDPAGASEAYRQALAAASPLGGIIDEEFVRLKLEALSAGSGGDAS